MELENGAGKTLAASLILNHHGRGDASHTEGEGIATKCVKLSSPSDTEPLGFRPSPSCPSSGLALGVMVFSK